MFKVFKKIIGPGVITGAADNDPSGIATYSQTGSQFGYGQLWTTLFILPFLISIQELCARIGAVTGKGLAGVVREHSNKYVLYLMIFLIFIANTINIGADLGAMAAATNLLLPFNFKIFVIFFSLLILVAQIFLVYPLIAKILKWLCLFLLAYPLTLFMVHVPWTSVLKATFIPHIEFTFQFFFIITAVLGTTISPYLFFWQASQEVEEKNNDIKEKSITSQIKNLRIDNFLGMLFSQMTTWSIIAMTAIVLINNYGITDIKTAADAAKALEPLVQSFPNAGLIAKCIFSIGIIGLGLLAIPVLTGSTAYAVGEAFLLPVGLNLKLKQGHAFYGIILLEIFIGCSINFFNINAMKLLVYAAVINGVIAVPLIFMILRIGSNIKIMGENTSGRLSTCGVWATFIGMAASTIAMFITFSHGH